LIASHRIHFYDETKRIEPVRVSKNFGRSAKSEKENTLLKPTARGASSPLYLEAYPRRAVCYRHILLAQREAWIRELGENEERWVVRLGALPRMTSEAEGLDVVHSREPLDSAADEGDLARG
jgi:hypothetical protein